MVRATMDVHALFLIAVVFTLAGFVKGVIGLGMPSISLALLTAAFGLPHAMALMVVPTVATNLWQGLAGGHAMTLTRRLWPFLAVATATVWIGGMAMGVVDPGALSVLLGVLLIVYGTIGLSRIRMVIPVRHERSTGLLLGALNGMFTGMTGSSVVPGSCICRPSVCPGICWFRQWVCCSRAPRSLWRWLCTGTAS